MNPQMPPETQREQQSKAVTALAARSALFFGLFHLQNLLYYPPSTVLVQIMVTCLFGFGFAACRMRTNTICPLIIFHAGNELIAFSASNGGIVPPIYDSLWLVYG